MIFLENSCQQVSGNILVIFFNANYTSDAMSNLADAVKSDYKQSNPSIPIYFIWVMFQLSS